MHDPATGERIWGWLDEREDTFCHECQEPDDTPATGQVDIPVHCHSCWELIPAPLSAQGHEEVLDVAREAILLEEPNEIIIAWLEQYSGGIVDFDPAVLQVLKDDLYSSGPSSDHSGF